MSTSKTTVYTHWHNADDKTYPVWEVPQFHIGEHVIGRALNGQWYVRKSADPRRLDNRAGPFVSADAALVWVAGGRK